MVNITLALITAILCAFAYRFGGCSKEEGKQKYPWVPQWMFSSWIRDCWCSFFSVIWMFACYPKVPWFIYLITFGATWGMFTTYWDRLFGFDNYWFHGFAIGIVYLGFALFTGIWLGLIIRSIALALLMGGISAMSGNVDVEELGRGAAFGITLPLMLI